MSNKVMSPLPGSVWEIKVAEGDTVEEDQVVIILEAMKMENEILTDFAGTVKKILVEKGQTVKAGDPLVEIE
ncbi:MAG TPA: acetyl-CoA carboxylase biotin carboxyl carrier protein subunit [Candidatus Copromorpha excrementigallinarum]|uniref:Acetyl-CoA carboxylase biotin carboxyl carrier protein subunit n=1 Tax=Candidatus Allocopromorpha excrementigallinarum TaxID=2840742 RepID=A0A9D1I1Y9_9FIRM|nr:acetyl-CoA carboxylase biotin carboxyl carrier protein subunit [Candidatus Copromorpha excrementigallinarum]